jgi:recombination protein RecR
MRIAKPIQNLIEAFSKLPGVGPKSAQRLTYYLLHVPQIQLDEFAESISNLKKNTVLCSKCKNVSETDPCPICSDTTRDHSSILVVEQPLDLIAFERTGRFKGVYHVLHGAINPLDNIGPDEIFVQDLLDRIKNKQSLLEYHEELRIKEVIIATNPTMEGNATAMYLAKQIQNSKFKIQNSPRVTRLGMGIPTGADLEYADDMTLSQALEGRREL